MTGAAKKIEAVFPEGNFYQHFLFCTVLDHSEIQLIFQNLSDDFAGILHRNFQPALWIMLLKPGSSFRHQKGSCSDTGSQPDTPSISGREEIFLHFLGKLQKMNRIIIQPLPLLRDKQLPVQPLKKPDTILLFQLLHRLAHPWLCQMKPLRRFRDTHFLIYCYENIQMS